MNQQLQLHHVPFHHDTLFIIDHHSQPYVPLRPIVENMGLDWAAQFTKIKAREERFSVVMIATQMPGDDQRREMVCIPLRKIAGWLYSIHPDKVSPQLKEKIEVYQNDCDEVLWNYWTTGIGLTNQQMAEESACRDARLESAQEEIIRLQAKCVTLLEEKVALLEAGKRKRVNRPLTEEEKQEIVAMVASGMSQGEVSRKMRRSSATVSYLVSERLRAAGVEPKIGGKDERQMELFPAGAAAGEEV